MIGSICPTANAAVLNIDAGMNLTTFALLHEDTSFGPGYFLNAGLDFGKDRSKSSKFLGKVFLSPAVGLTHRSTRSSLESFSGQWINSQLLVGLPLVNQLLEFKVGPEYSLGLGKVSLNDLRNNIASETTFSDGGFKSSYWGLKIQVISNMPITKSRTLRLQFDYTKSITDFSSRSDSPIQIHGFGFGLGISI